MFDETKKRAIEKDIKESLIPLFQQHINNIVSMKVPRMVEETVEKVVKEQVADWNKMYIQCCDTAYSTDGKITAIWFYLTHPKGFCFRVDRTEGRCLKDNQWTFFAQLLCYFDYVYQGEIHTVTIIEAPCSEIDRYISARVYEETDTVYRILIETLNADGSVEVSRYEVIKAEARLQGIEVSKENVKRFDEHGDEKDAVIRFRSEQ